MSNFDDNPFGDPFSDPSITQATSRTDGNDPSLADYNPFANQPTQPMNTNTAPAVLPTQGQMTSNSNEKMNPPPTARSGTSSGSKSNLTHEDLQKRQEELERKAAELAAREEALRTQSGSMKTPNWPPVPAICPFQPCFYQDINVEIPVEFQKLVRYAYYLWMYFVFVMIVNMFGGLATFIVEQSVTDFGSSILYLILLTPISFVCWFRPLYKAFRQDSSFNFMVFFFVFFIHIVLTIFWTLGFTSIGSGGLFGALASIGKHSVFYTIFLFVCTAVLTSYDVFAILVLLKVHSIYRSSGASFAKAQVEFAEGVMKNEHVQHAATGAATAAARSAMANAASGDSGFRY